MKPTSKRMLGKIARDRRGTTAIMFAMMFGVMVLSAGAAVDIGRWMHAKTITSSALDAAVLAGGRKLQLEPGNEAAALLAAQQYYQQNVAQRLQLQSDSVTFAVTADGKALTASGSAYISTTLLNVAGIDRLPVIGEPGSVFPRAQLQVGGGGGSNIEVALVLDVTGSMCNNNHGPCTDGHKMTGLKAAAKDLIDIVVADNQSQHTSRVALVPFSTRIRVAPDASGGAIMQQLTGLTPTWSGWYDMCVDSNGSGGSEDAGNWTCRRYESQYQTNWKIMPCVTDRAYNATWTLEVTDDAPGAGRWLNAHGGDRRVVSDDSSDTPAVGHLGAASTDPAWHWNYDSWGGCADVANANEVLPLSSNKATLKSRIDGLEAFGSTGGALGTAWGWYMLSPKWNSIWTGTSAPGAYSDLTTSQANGAPVLRKVAVIMSDGVYNTVRSWKDQDQQEVSNYAKQMCTNMKAAGIEIYTVAFALDQLPAGERAVAEDTLRSCGSSVQHFYSTLTVEHMQQAFRDIALQLSALYLAK
jgi:Flp pilus assembly protein TadG